MFQKVLVLILFLNKKFASTSDVLLSSKQSNEDNCSSDGCDENVTLDCDAIFTARGVKKSKDYIVPLKDVLSDDANLEWRNSEKMFFVESSGNDHLKIRQVSLTKLGRCCKTYCSSNLHLSAVS
jgi:hypothetical protein